MRFVYRHQLTKSTLTMNIFMSEYHGNTLGEALHKSLHKEHTFGNRNAPSFLTKAQPNSRDDACRRLRANLNGLRQAIPPYERAIEQARSKIVQISNRAAAKADRSFGQAIGHAVFAVLSLIPAVRVARTTLELIRNAERIRRTIIGLFKTTQKISDGDRTLRSAGDEVGRVIFDIEMWNREINNKRRQIEQTESKLHRLGCRR
jgi:hypothetical protein